VMLHYKANARDDAPAVAILPRNAHPGVAGLAPRAFFATAAACSGTQPTVCRPELAGSVVRAGSVAREWRPAGDAATTRRVCARRCRNIRTTIQRLAQSAIPHQEFIARHCRAPSITAPGQ
jgi:hypothetical protein